MSDVERVAKAICAQDPEVRMGDAEGVVQQRVDHEWQNYMPQASAAMRETQLIDAEHRAAGQAFRDRMAEKGGSFAAGDLPMRRGAKETNDGIA